MARAAKCTIAQVSEVVPLGALDPEAIVTPGIFVQRVVPVSAAAKAAARTGEIVMNRMNRDQMAARVARDIPEGAYVNLGIGLPTRVANFLPKDREIFLQSENGLLGMGPAPAKDAVDWDLINAGQGTGNATHRRRVLPSRRLVRHDARRASRHLRARRVPGCGERRSRELAHRCAGRDSRGRRGDGSRHRREEGVRDDGAPDQGGRNQDRRAVHAIRSRGSAA